ncbi:MAG: peptidase [Pseudomonas sp.]|nr:peptidase [Pseudomonas sp.]
MSYRYGITSRNRLDTCHPDLKKIFNTLIEYDDVSILCGHRSEKEQDIAFRSGVTKVMWPNSKHNLQPSMAVDAAPYPIDWNDHKRFAVFAGRVLQVADELYSLGLIDYKIRWGGDWDRDGSTTDQTFNDLPHFELYKSGE